MNDKTQKIIWLSVGLVGLLLGFIAIIMQQYGVAFFFTAIGVVVYLVMNRVNHSSQE